MRLDDEAGSALADMLTGFLDRGDANLRKRNGVSSGLWR